MDDYDPACPTEDEPHVMDIDLSQVPLPPSSPEGSKSGQLSEKDVKTKDRRRKKKKKRHEKTAEQDQDIEKAEKEQSDKDIPETSSSQESFHLNHPQKGIEDIPNLEPAGELSDVDTREDEPPSLLPESTSETASKSSTPSMPKPVPSGSGTRLSNKLQFKLASDPSSGKAKVLFQLNKSTKLNPLNLAPDEGEEKNEAEAEAEKQIIEKTSAGEYVPTRFKVSKKHEMFKPLQVPSMTIVFNSNSIVSSNSTVATSSSASSAEMEISHEDLASATSKWTKSDEKEEDSKKPKKDESEDRPLRRSDRMAARRESRTEDRKKVEESKSGSHQREESSSRRGRSKHQEDLHKNEVVDDNVTRRRSSRIKSEDSDDKKTDKDNGRNRSTKQQDVLKGSHRRTRSSRRSRSASRERPRRSPSPLKKSTSKDTNKSENVNNKMEEKVNLILDTSCEKNSGDVPVFKEDVEMDLVQISSQPLQDTALEQNTAESVADKSLDPDSQEDEDSKKHLQKLVIRRSVETNGFQVTRNDLADVEGKEQQSPAKNKSEEKEKPQSEEKEKLQSEEKEKPQSDVLKDQRSSSKDQNRSSSKKHHGHRERNEEASRRSSRRDLRKKRTRTSSSSSEDQKAAFQKKLPPNKDSSRTKHSTFGFEEPPLAPEQVLVDVSAIPGKSKWELEDEDEEEKEKKPLPTSTYDFYGHPKVELQRLPAKSYETLDVSWRRSSRLQTDKNLKASVKTKTRHTSSNDEDFDSARGKEKKKHRSKEKKGKKKKKRHDGSSTEESHETIEKPEVKKVTSEKEPKGKHCTEKLLPDVKKKEESTKSKADIDTAKLVTYLKEYSEKEEFSYKEEKPKPKNEPDKTKIVKYLKEYSTMSTDPDHSVDEGRADSSGKDSGKEIIETETIQEKKEDIVDSEEKVRKSESKIEDSDKEDIDESTNYKSPELTPERKKQSLSPEQKERRGRSTSADRVRERKRRSMSLDKVNKKRERSTSSDRIKEKEKSKSPEKTYEKRGRSKSSEKSKEKWSKSPERTRDRRGRSKSSEKNRDKRDRSKSRDRRDRSKSSERIRDRRDRSKSREKQERSRSVEKYRKGQTSFRQKSPGRMRGRRNRSRSGSKGRTARDWRNRSRSRSYERNSFYRRYRSPGRGRRDRYRRGRSRSDSRDRYSDYRKRGSEDKSQSKHIKQSLSPEKTIKKEPDISSSSEILVKAEEGVSSDIDLTTIPIPSEIPLPGEEIKLKEDAKMEKKEFSDSLVVEPMDISDGEASEGPESSASQSLPSEILHVQNVPEQEASQVDSQVSTKDKQIKFSIAGSVKKIKPVSALLESKPDLPTKVCEDTKNPDDKGSVQLNTKLEQEQVSKDEGACSETVKLSQAEDLKNTKVHPFEEDSDGDDIRKVTKQDKKKEKKPDVPAQRLKFKYVPLWEMEESEARPVMESPKKPKSRLSLALDYGSDSSDSEAEQKSETSQISSSNTEAESGNNSLVIAATGETPSAKPETDKALMVDPKIEKDSIVEPGSRENSLAESESEKGHIVDPESEKDHMVEKEPLVEPKPDGSSESCSDLISASLEQQNFVPKEVAPDVPNDDLKTVDTCTAENSSSEKNSKEEITQQASSPPHTKSSEEEAYSPSHPSLEDADDIFDASPSATLIKLPSKTEGLPKHSDHSFGIVTSMPLPIPSITTSLSVPLIKPVVAPSSVATTSVNRPALDIPLVAYPRLPLSSLTGESLPSTTLLQNASSLIKDVSTIPLPGSHPLPPVQSQVSLSQNFSCPVQASLSTSTVMPVTYPILPQALPKAVPPPVLPPNISTGWAPLQSSSTSQAYLSKQGASLSHAVGFQSMPTPSLVTSLTPLGIVASVPPPGIVGPVPPPVTVAPVPPPAVVTPVTPSAMVAPVPPPGIVAPVPPPGVVAPVPPPGIVAPVPPPGIVAPVPPPGIVAPVPPPGIVAPVPPPGIVGPVPPPGIVAPIPPPGVVAQMPPQGILLPVNQPTVVLPAPSAQPPVSLEPEAPIKYRINRFHQVPAGHVPQQAIPPPSVSIPTLQPPTVVVPLSLSSVPSLNTASALPLSQTSQDGSKTVQKKLEQPTAVQISKRPKISSILAQPKIDDPKVLELFSKGEADVKSLPLLTSSRDSAPVEKPPAPKTVKEEGGSNKELLLSKSDANSEEAVDTKKQDKSALESESKPKETIPSALAENINFDTSSIPLPEDPPKSIAPVPLSPKPEQQENSTPLPISMQTESTSDGQLSSLPPVTSHLDNTPSASTPPMSSPPKSQSAVTLLAERKKRFNQSPLAIGMLPKIPLSQSPLAIGPLPKLPPEPEEEPSKKGLASLESPARKSNPAELKPKVAMQISGLKFKKPDIEEAKPSGSGSKIHIVLRSKLTIQKTLVPGFEDEASDEDVATEEMAQLPEPPGESERIPLSAFKEDSEEPIDTSCLAVSGSTEGMKREEQISSKFVTPGNIEAYPVQVITSSRNEEDTPASTWPEFTVGTGKGEGATKKSSKSDTREKKRDEDEDRTPVREDDKKRSREESDRRENRRRYEEEGSRRHDDDNDDRGKRKIKKEKEDGYDDRRRSDDRRRNDNYNRRPNRDDDESDYRRRGKEDEDSRSRRRSQYDKEDDRKRRKYEKYFDRDRSRERERSRDRDQSRDRSLEREKSFGKSKSKSYRKRNKDRSRSRSPSRKRERDRSRERYDRTRQRDDRSLSRSRSASPKRDRKSLDDNATRYTSKTKENRSFKEDILEELSKTSLAQDGQSDLFKVTAISSTYPTEYPSEQRHYPIEPTYLPPDSSMYPPPPAAIEMPPTYPDPNYSSQYPLPYEHQQFVTPWQGQPSHETYAQDVSSQYQPPPADHQAPLPTNPYQFHPQSAHYSPQVPPPPFQAGSYHAPPAMLPPTPTPVQPALPAHVHVHPHNIPLDQQQQPVPPVHITSVAQHPVPYTQAAPPTFPPPTFSHDPKLHYANSQYTVRGGALHGPVLPPRAPLLQTPHVSSIVSDSISSFGSNRFPSPTQVKMPEVKPVRKSRFNQPDDQTVTESSPLWPAVSNSETPTTPSRGDKSRKQPVSALFSLPEPSFENSSLAEAEFDACIPQEMKGKSKKRSSAPVEEVNEPTVSSSSIEDTGGDTGSDSGTDTSSQRPLKVKSRWRRNSEAEAVVDTSTPPQASVPSKLASPPPDSSPVEMRRTRSRAAAEEMTVAQAADTPPPPPPPRKRIKNELDLTGLDNQQNEESKSTVPAEEKEQDLETLVKRTDFPKFEIISENIHLTERKRSKSMKRMLCDCTTSREDRAMGIEACGSDCLNRMLMIECGARCPCGEYCTNRRFQKKVYSKTLPFSAGEKGWGLKADEDLEEKGTFIMEYVGELLDFEEFVRRTRQYSKEGRKHHYFMALNADEVVDATLQGNISRFINHSCDPNCETQKWTVNGELRVGFFTRKPIKKGEELTFDYQFEHYGEPQKCYCGSENCRGYIGLVKSPTRNKKKEKKRREIFKDELLEEDIEKLSLLDGMRNKNDVLELCRLMVRAEKVQHRMAILKILQDTTEAACLRLFLDYHGLPLFWSWMADIGTADYSEDTQELKLLMLSVLKCLPITNKTVLKESKILDIVERWAMAAVAAARKPPPPPPPTSAPPTLSTDSQDASMDAVASDNEAVATLETSETDAPTPVPPSEPEPSASSSETTPPSSPSPVLPLPVSTVTPVSILSSAKDTKEAKQKRRVTFAEVHVETAFSPEPPEEDDAEENDNITSSTQYSESGSVLLGEGLSLRGNKVGLADSTSQKDIFDLGDMSGVGSDTDNSDTELVNQDPLASLAAECMSQWSSLKEVFKIPKKERVEERKRTERELDVLSKKEPEASDPYAKWKRGRSRAFVRKKTAEEDEKKSSLPKMSKEERRQRFEAQVKAEDELAAQAAAEEYQRQQEAYMLHQQRLMEDPAYFYSFHLQQGEPTSLDSSMAPPEGVDSVTGQPAQAETLVDPQTGQHYMGSMGQTIIDPNTGHPVLHIDPNTGQPLLQIDPNTGQPLLQIDPNTGQPLLQIDPNTGQPLLQIDPNTGQPLLQIDPNTGQPLIHHQIDPQTGQAIDPLTGQPIDPMTGQHVHPTIDPHTGQPILSTVDPTTGQLVHQIVSLAGQQPLDSHTGQPIVQPHVHSMDPLSGQLPPETVIDPMTGHLIQHSVLSYPPQSLLSHPTSQVQIKHSPATHLPVAPKSSISGLSELDMEEEVPPPPSPPTVPVTKLPPNWKTAKDSEGRVYYYHAFTRQTQWEMPSWDEDEDSLNDMELDPLPPEEIIRQSKKKTTTAAADTSSEVARKIKDSFRIKMSNHIILYLNPYRKKDCKVGRISSTDDFKHLARKLTHHVMSKELKHCRHVEDLEVNENVKAKAKDYVRKYMSKFGANYKKSSSPQPD